MGIGTNDEPGPEGQTRAASACRQFESTRSLKNRVLQSLNRYVISDSDPEFLNRVSLLSSSEPKFYDYFNDHNYKGNSNPSAYKPFPKFR